MPDEQSTETVTSGAESTSTAGDSVSATEASTDDAEYDEPETFPRSYVEELRQENGKYRQRAAKAATYAQRLHTELVRATGKLADPTDMPFDEDHLDSPDALAKAVDELLARKPHLAARRPVGDIGQGATPSPATVDLAALLRQRAQ